MYLDLQGKNYSQYVRLQNEIYILSEKKINKSQNQPLIIKSKSKSSYQPNNFTHSEDLQQIIKKNNTLQAHINTLKQRNAMLSQPIHPISEQKKQRIMELQKTISQLSKEVNFLSGRNRAFTQAYNKPDMFEQYEGMIRQCEGWRRTNDQLAQQLKSIIVQLNQKTGKDENPNLILINIK